MQTSAGWATPYTSSHNCGEVQEYIFKEATEHAKRAFPGYFNIIDTYPANLQTMAIGGCVALNGSGPVYERGGLGRYVSGGVWAGM
jgi:hypothetical protein